MEQKKSNVTTIFMVGASYRAQNAFYDYIELSNKIVTDSSIEDRLKKHECKACFYIFPKWGGSAITNKPCGICGEMQVYGSTNTDVLCLPCAVKYGLCKHCGGDIDMKVTRRDWPSVITDDERGEK